MFSSCGSNMVLEVWQHCRLLYQWILRSSVNFAIFYLQIFSEFGDLGKFGDVVDLCIIYFSYELMSCQLLCQWILQFFCRFLSNLGICANLATFSSIIYFFYELVIFFHLIISNNLHLCYTLRVLDDFLANFWGVVFFFCKHLVEF